MGRERVRHGDQQRRPAVGAGSMRDDEAGLRDPLRTMQETPDAVLRNCRGCCGHNDKVIITVNL
jgi:hypothetical protein